MRLQHTQKPSCMKFFTDRLKSRPINTRQMKNSNGIAKQMQAITLHVLPVRLTVLRIPFHSSPLAFSLDWPVLRSLSLFQF